MVFQNPNNKKNNNDNIRKWEWMGFQFVELFDYTDRILKFKMIVPAGSLSLKFALFFFSRHER